MSFATSFYQINGSGDLEWSRVDPNMLVGQRLHMNSGFRVASSVDRSRLVFGGKDGIFYVIDYDGTLHWYKHLYPGIGHEPGQPDMSSAMDPRSGVQVSTVEEWGLYDYVFTAANGAIYGVSRSGSLQWHRHREFAGSGSDWSSQHGRNVGSAWDMFRGAFAAPNKVIYAQKWDGTLYWYKHEGQANGTPFSAGTGGLPLGSMWRDFVSLFAGPAGSLFGV